MILFFTSSDNLLLFFVNKRIKLDNKTNPDKNANNSENNLGFVPIKDKPFSILIVSEKVAIDTQKEINETRITFRLSSLCFFNKDGNININLVVC